MPAFPEAKFANINGIRMAYYEEGKGLPVIFSHGFPELAFSWRYQLPAVAAAGFHAVAPDQRGYGLTDCPKAVSDYDITHLTGDLIALLDHIGAEKGIFCGHDWGGMVVWSLAMLHPDRVAGVIGVNTPFLPRGPMPPVDMMKAALGDNHYIVHFCKENSDADARLDANPRRVISQLYRKAGSMDIKKMRDEMMEQMKKTGKMPSMNICDMVEGPDSTAEPCIDEAELAYYTAAFERTGFTGGINWYRNMNRNWQIMEKVPQKVEVPSLMISAKNDVALPPSMARGMEKYVPDLEFHIIPECGHWTQAEKPKELNTLMTDWLQRRFC